MRILAIDYGTKTTGLAITDYSQFLANPLVNIRATNNTDLIQKIKIAISKYAHEISTILVGYPTLLNGNKNQTTLAVEEFIVQLKQTFKDYEIITFNEQYTTYVATEDLYEVGLNHKQIKNNKDKVSAVYILNAYLNKK